MERLLRGAGLSTADSPGEAGRAAAASAVAGLHEQGEGPATLVLVHASVRYDLDALLAGVRSVTGSVPLAGVTTAGHFAGDRMVEPGTGVSVLALGGDRYRFGVAAAEGMGHDPAGTGATVARTAKAACRATATDGSLPPHAAFVLLTDGLGGDQQAVLTGVHRVCGAAVPVIGGAAGDDSRMRSTSVLHDDRVLTGAVVGVWIGSSRPLSVASAHGWTAISDPLLITRAEGRTVHEIGGRAAGDVYLALIEAAGADLRTGTGGPPAALRSETALWPRSFGLGLIQPDGSYLVRGAIAAPGGVVTTFTPVPPFSAVQVMSGDRPAVLAAVDDVVGRALVHGDETVVLTFDCVSRYDILGTDQPEEVARMAEAAGDALNFGFYTYGEFARDKGVGGVHNATLTALAL